MSYGINIAGQAKRAVFRQAGGAIIKVRHPYFAGQLAVASSASKSIDGTFDEIDISASCKLDAEFLRAEQFMDSSKMTVMVDGSCVIITNAILAGTMTLQLVPTTGLLATGDAVAAFHLLKSVGDKVGGVISHSEVVNGKVITKFFYGMTVQNIPDDVAVGNDVAVYAAKIMYTGWIQTVSEASVAAEDIWASGNNAGITAVFSQLGINTADSAATAAATVGTSLGDSSVDDTSATSGVANYDADILAALDADSAMLGVDYVDGVSVLKLS